MTNPENSKPSLHYPNCRADADPKAACKCAEWVADRLSQVENERLRTRLEAVEAVLGYREAELLRQKGPCSNLSCSAHYAHDGPCVTSAPGMSTAQVKTSPEEVEAKPGAQDMQSAGPEPKRRVHNHPPYRPVCRELFDEHGRLVGDCVREERDPDGEALVRFLREHSLDWSEVEGQTRYYCICDESAGYWDSVEGHAYHLATTLRRSGFLASRAQAEVPLAAPETTGGGE